MPYIIETRDAATGAFRSVDIGPLSRRAVATLEEARSGARRIVGEHTNHYVDAQGQMIAAAQALGLPESGGIIGPLPDGTVIEVRHVDWPYLRAKAGRLPVSTHSKEDVIEAFNKEV